MLPKVEVDQLDIGTMVRHEHSAVHNVATTRPCRKSVIWNGAASSNGRGERSNGGSRIHETSTLCCSHSTSIPTSQRGPLRVDAVEAHAKEDPARGQSANKARPNALQRGRNERELGSGIERSMNVKSIYEAPSRLASRTAQATHCATAIHNASTAISASRTTASTGPSTDLSSQATVSRKPPSERGGWLVCEVRRVALANVNSMHK